MVKHFQEKDFKEAGEDSKGRSPERYPLCEYRETQGTGYHFEDRTSRAFDIWVPTMLTLD